MENWRLQAPVEAIVFDCDGTLSKLEGIDALASQNGVGEQVKQLTAHAMGETGLNESIYQERLQLVKPKAMQVEALAKDYYHHRVKDIEQLIQILQRLGKTVYIVSAGLYPAVAGFGALLQVPKPHIFAVEIHFDEQGNYSGFDRKSPLIHNQGKREIVAHLKQKHAAIAYIGDGMNDLSVMDLVVRFIGYGGAFYFEKVAARCDYYIKSTSISPLLPLILTLAEMENLLGNELRLYEQGNAEILNGEVILH